MNLVKPIDRMSPGDFPYLMNVRVLKEGTLESRPGYVDYITTPSPNSIRRLNDPSQLYAPTGFIYVGGGASTLYAGPALSYNAVDTGYSGNPLSLIPFRPEQSPESWMYVYDANKQSKVRPDGAVRQIGVIPPSTAPDIELGVPATVDVNTGSSISGSWSTTGVAGVLSLQTRIGGLLATQNVIYNSGSTGWCCISPNLGYATAGSNGWMKVVLNASYANEENVLVREVHPAITSTTVAAISYDSGTTGNCSVILTGYPTGLDRNSLIQIDSEVVRVLSVILDLDGVTYCLRCKTSSTHVAGASVTGMISWYVYTTLTHTTGESISSSYVQSSNTASGVGAVQYTGSVDASTANGRPIDPANDYLHISIYMQFSSAVDNLQILLNMDVTPNLSFDDPGNSYIWTVTRDQLVTSGSGGTLWVDLDLPISDATKYGTDPTTSLATIGAIALQLTSTGLTNWGFDWWYLFGTYGPSILPNAPVGYSYTSRNRDFSTGAASVPGPLTRYQLFPLRESVIITPQPTSQVGVDTLDVYKIGGGIETTPLYDASVANNVGSPVSLTDVLPDSAILETNQPVDTTLLQPWPLLQPPIVGVCSVVGTSVLWVSGGTFPLSLLSSTAILINGRVYLTFGQPTSSGTLQLTQSAGNQSNVAFQIDAPTLSGQTSTAGIWISRGSICSTHICIGRSE